MVNTEAVEYAGISSETNNLQFDVVRYGIQVGRLRLLLPSQILNEVVDGEVIYPVPNTPKWFLGVINHRGNIVSIFDLKEIFFDKGLCSQQGNQSCVLVIGKGDGAVGILIDDFPQVIDLEKREMESHVKIPEILERHLISSADDDWREVDFPGLFEEIGEMVLA